MKKGKKLILAACTIELLCSCQLFVEPLPKSWHWGATPRPLTGVRGFPSADTDYGKGFKDGCGAAWDTVSKGFLSEINNRGVNPKKLGVSSDYNIGWFDGFEQCTYILDWSIT